MPCCPLLLGFLSLALVHLKLPPSQGMWGWGAFWLLSCTSLGLQGALGGALGSSLSTYCVSLLCQASCTETAQDFRGNNQVPSPLELPNLSGSSPSLPLPSKTRFPPLQDSSRGCIELLFQIKLRDTILSANNFNHSPLPFFYPKQGFLKI